MPPQLAPSLGCQRDVAVSEFRELEALLVDIIARSEQPASTSDVDSILLQNYLVGVETQ